MTKEERRKEKRRLYSRKQRLLHPEKMREYCRRGSAKWRAKNPDKVREYKKKWRALNADKHRLSSEKSTNKWRKEHPDLYKARQSRYGKELRARRRTEYLEESMRLLGIQPDGIRKPYGVIYEVYNTVTRRWYIGETKTTLRQRYPKGFLNSTSNKLILQDKAKYGEDSFVGPTVIAVAYSQAELDLLEVQEIKSHNATDPECGYNQNHGNVKRARRLLLEEKAKEAI